MTTDRRFYDVFFNPITSLCGSQFWIEMPVFRLEGHDAHMTVDEYYIDSIGLDGENFEDYRNDNSIS